MKYNLIPPDVQKPDKQYSIILERYAAAVVGSCIAAAALAAGVVCFFLAEQEKERYMNTTFFIQQRIIRQNELERRLQDIVEQMRKADEGKIHWPSVLVCLADTKPENIMVEALSVRSNRITLSGRTAVIGAERQWQDRLRRHEGIKSAAVSLGKKEKDAAYPSFTMEVEVNYASDMESP